MRSILPPAAAEDLLPVTHQSSSPSPKNKALYDFTHRDCPWAAALGNFASRQTTAIWRSINWPRALSILMGSHLLFVCSLTPPAAMADPTSPTTSAVAARSHHPQIRFDEGSLQSSSALVLDVTSSSVLFAKRADVAMPIASITKLMTALVVLDGKQSLGEPIEITSDDQSSKKGAYSRLTVGTTLSRGELLHLALMSSENRAAHALGRSYPGGLPAFLQAMSAKAWALGMINARFVDPTGLSSENVTSSEDLTKLVIAASQNLTIREYSTDKAYAVRVGRRMIRFRNTNVLVSNPAWNIIVQKTGYIAESGKCMVMETSIEGRTVVIVLLNSVSKYTRVADAMRIRKWMEATLSERRSRMTVSKADPGVGSLVAK